MYKIVYALESKEKDYKKITPTVRDLIRKAIETRLTVDPNNVGKPLRYSLKGHRRLRVGDYRVIYRVDNDLVIVYIIEIDHRKDLYES